MLGAVVLGACAREHPDPFQSSEAAGAPPTTQATAPLVRSATPTPEPLHLVGWMSIVWNDEPHFFLTDDGGRTYEILLDEELTAPLGGPLALDRARVSVLAVVTQASPELYEALSIALEGGS